MSNSTRLKYLRIALVLVGIIFIFGLYLLMIAWPSIWPSGWTWHTGHSDYPLMIVGVYATLGVFLLLAARSPLDNLARCAGLLARTERKARLLLPLF